nr:MAG TPA: hypothetical protein [Caudoviricetes sp.]
MAIVNAMYCKLLSFVSSHLFLNIYFNMLNYVSKKISDTFLLSAFAILKRVPVVVVVIAPLSKPDIIVRDTPLFSANSH